MPGTPAHSAATRVTRFLGLCGRAAWRAFVRFYNSNDLTYASSIAFFALMSFFPFLLLALSVLGIATADDADRAAVLGFVLRYLPRQFDFITAQIDALRQSPLGLGVAGSSLMAWAALGVFGAITTAVNYSWGVEKTPNYFQHKLVSFLMMVAAGLLLLLALLVVSLRDALTTSWFADALRGMPWLQLVSTFTFRGSTTLLLIGVVGLIFYFVPNTTVRFRDVWPGAVLTGLLWRGALAGFSYYVTDLSRFSVHGSIAAVVVFLFWVYITSVILLYGVEFTAAFADLLGDRPRPAGAVPRRG
ncbi:MAG: ribonuclease BN/unknown domain fusion protein [Acidobacteria bacterium]|nr:ribonuclease BN/unknown domain fusion protein [Acidobacteriota bacterium]